MSIADDLEEIRLASSLYPTSPGKARRLQDRGGQCCALEAWLVDPKLPNSTRVFRSRPSGSGPCLLSPRAYSQIRSRVPYRLRDAAHRLVPHDRFATSLSTDSVASLRPSTVVSEGTIVLATMVSPCRIAITAVWMLSAPSGLRMCAPSNRPLGASTMSLERSTSITDGERTRRPVETDRSTRRPPPHRRNRRSWRQFASAKPREGYCLS